MKSLLRIVCWARGRHKWSKPHFEHLGGGVYATVGDRFKTCRCGATSPVKRRKKEAK